MSDVILYAASAVVLGLIALLALLQFSGGPHAGHHRRAPETTGRMQARREELGAYVYPVFISLLAMAATGGAAALLIYAVATV
jgi:hypothetical protein